MRWAIRSLVVVMLLLGAAVAVPFFVRVDEFIPRIEKEASAKLLEPVTIKSIRLAMLPVPRVTIDGISIGKAADIQVGEVVATPALLSLFSTTRVIRSLEVKSLVVTQQALARLPVWVKSGVDPAPSPVRIEHLRFTDANVKLDHAAFGPFDADVQLDAGAHPVAVFVNTRDGKLKVALKPDNAGYSIDATAHGWQLPAGPPVVFDELAVKGVATVTGAEVSEMTAKLYGGTVRGTSTVGWHKGLQIKGRFAVNQVELKSLLPLFSPNAKLSGRLSAKPVFSVAAASVDRLVNALHLETPFEVHNGVLRGIDIAKAATSLVKSGATGGETHFDHLAGFLVRDRGAHKLSELKISSGSLAADGNVNVSAKQELSGRVTAQLKAAGVSAGIPLNVAGTVQSPLLYPTGGTMAGAAIGSVILPGVGTGLGAKLGQSIESLFSSQKK